MLEPKITVIVPLYNQGEFLEECIESVIAQTFREFEIIIMDDCSTDNSWQVAQDLLWKHRHIGVIRVFHHEKNLGVATARNTAASFAKSKYGVCLDADDALEPTYLETVYANRDKADIVYTDTRKFGLVNKVNRKTEYSLENLKQWNIFNVTFLFQLEHFREVGGYDEEISNLEDWEFALRMGLAGHTGYRIPEPLFCYRQKATGRYKSIGNTRPAIKKYIYKKLGL